MAAEVVGHAQNVLGRQTFLESMRSGGRWGTTGADRGSGLLREGSSSAEAQAYLTSHHTSQPQTGTHKSKPVVDP